MKTKTFDIFLAEHGHISGQPMVLDAAMREIALSAWNAAVASAADLLTMKTADILLCAGELTSNELRTTKAVLNGRAAAIKQLEQLELNVGKLDHPAKSQKPK